MGEIVTCTTSFTTGGMMYGQGREFDADDPIVKRYPGMFTDVVRTTATVPGEVASPPPAEPVKKATKRAAKRTGD